MQLGRQAPLRRGHRLDKGIARQQKLAIDRLQKLCPPLPRIGAARQIQHRMHLIAPVAILQDQRQGRRRLGNQLHRAKAHRIAQKARLRQPHQIARTPDRTPGTRPGDDRTRRTGLALGHGLRRRPLQKPKHHPPLLWPMTRPPAAPPRVRRSPGPPLAEIFRPTATASADRGTAPRAPGSTRSRPRPAHPAGPATPAP